MNPADWFNIINFGLVILIWLVQLIIYPSFSSIDAADFSAWHRSYIKRIVVVVAPLMLAQLFLACLTFLNNRNLPGLVMLAGILLIWLASLTLSLPCHRRLQREGKDNNTIQRLVRTNWIRTVLWSIVFLIGLVSL